MSQYFRIGKFVTAFGVAGELVLVHSLGKRSALKDVRAIFIEERKEAFLPYFIEMARVRSAEETLVKLEGVISREAAAKLVQREVWLPEADFHRIAGKSAPISMLGFTIIEGEHKLGEVLEVIEQPHQVLCRIQINEKEVYVPLHEATIVRIDKKKKIIYVQLPEGLLDIYLD